MAQTNRERGGYANGEIVRLYGSFQTNGASAPTVLRDGHAFLFTVARISAGLFEITFASDGFPIPEKLVTERAWGTPAGAPTLIGKWDVVAGSYSQTTRKFRVQFTKIGALAAPTTLALSVTADADTGERVSFELVGSINSAGTDLA